MMRIAAPIALLITIGVGNGLFAAERAPESIVPRFLTHRDASTAPATPPEKWSASENVAWKTDVDGIGWSSPIVTGNRVIVTSCVNTGGEVEPRKGLYIEDLDANKYEPPKDEHLFQVICLDLATGETLWKETAFQGIPPKPHHIKNSLASETAATDGERIYARFGNIGLFCYDLDGKLLWEHAEPAYNTRYGWGTSMSPIVYQDRVYLVNDNEEESYLVALDKRTGEQIFRVERDEDTNYSTPYVWENELRTELVISGIGQCVSYDLDGNPLWHLKGKSILAIPSPFEHEGNLIVTSGHVLWGENPMYAIRPGATGDISPAEGETSNDYVIWYQPDAGPYHPTPLVVDGTLHVLLDRGFMAAYDVNTGEPVYSKKRIPKGRAFTSSPITYGGKLFCINEDGVTFAIKPGKDFEILYTNELADDDMAMSTPVIVGDRLLIRTKPRVYCIQATDGAAAAGD